LYQKYVFKPPGKLQFLLEMILETSLFASYENESKSVILVEDSRPLYKRNFKKMNRLARTQGVFFALVGKKERIWILLQRTESD